MQSGMQYYQQHRPARKQSAALETPLPEFIPPQGQRGQDIMIIWDFQNVRTPTELEPVEIIRFMYDTFVKQPGPRRCAGAFCTFTDNTKKAVGEKRFNQFCSNGVLNFMMINSPGGPRKADDSDHPLKEMMMNFTVDCVRGSKDGVLLLITADADFVRPAIWCKQQGCVSLELIYYDPIASKEIRQLEANWKMEWRDFLDCMMGRRCAWTFPYPQDVAAGLVPSNSSSSPGTGNYQYYSNGGGSSSSSGYQQDQQRRYQQQRQQQQQLHLPGPPPRLALPPPSGSSSGRQGYGSAAAAGGGGGGGSLAAGGAITVSNTHVDQAAEQLLHNPAALQQVVQQYKQSMQTTAVLQQVLQGVAQKATSSSATAAGAAAPGPAAQAYMRGSTTHLQQQQRAVPGGFTMSPSKPVNVLRRDAGAAAASSSSAAAAAAGASPYTWQQREQASARLTPENSSTSGSCRSPPPPEWWDPSASSGGNKTRRSSKGAAAAGGSGSMSRHGSSNGIWGGSGFDGGRTMSEDHSSSSEVDDAGFWDSSKPAGDVGAANRSSSGGRGLQAVSGSSGALSGADIATSSAAVGTGLPPPPSMGLMKRASGPVPGSGGKTSGSGGNLVALLAAAAASAGGGSTGSSPAKAARGPPGHQSPHHHHHHHHHPSQGSDGVLSPVDKHEQHHQAALAAAAAADGSYQQPRLLQQPSYGSLDQLRSPSPALTNRSDRSNSAQDRHMQHHEQQIMLAMQRGSKQRPFQDTGDTSAAAAADKGASSSSSSAMVNLFGGGGRATTGPGSSSCGDSGSPRQDHTGMWARPKPTSVGPGMAAAARILSRATAEAAADASRATGSHDGAGQGVSEGAAGGDEGVGTGARRSSTGGGVEIMEAPPLPPWMQQQQQQGQEAVVPGQGQQQQQSAANTAASSAREGGDEEEEEEEYVEDEETGEVILVKKPKQPRSLPIVPQQQQQQSSVPISVAAAGPGAAAAVRGRAFVGPDDAYEGSSEGGITPSNTPCAGIASWQAAGGGARMHFSSTQQPQHSRLHQWQQAAAAVDSPTDGWAHDDAPADDASGSCSGSCKSSSCSLNHCSICGEGRGGDAQHDDAADSSCVDRPLAVSIISQPSPSSSSGKDSPRLVRLQLEVRPAEGSGRGSGSAAVDTRCGADAEASSSSSGRGVVCGAADGDDDDAAELMQPLLGCLEGDSVGPAAEALVHKGRPGSQHPFPLSTELQALAAISQGLVGGSYAGEDMLPLPADADRHNRGLHGLTLLGPVLGPHDAAAGARGISPHHRPKQRSLVEQLEELQHILSADMAAEAAAAMGDAAAGGQEAGDPLDAAAASSAARASADGSVQDDGLGFEAVGLDGLPVYGPHLQPESHSNSESEDDEAKLLRMLAAASAAAPEPQDADADDDISLERMLQLLNAGSQPAAAGMDVGGLSAAQSSPIVVSAPPMPLRALSGSPVTAITELGNVSSAGSTSSRGMQ